MKTPHSMTVYKRTVVAGAETWTRMPVAAVMWEDRKAANVISSGLLEADSVAVYVPITPEILSIRGGDVLVKGLVEDEITATFTITALKKKYPAVVTVRSVDTMDYGSNHMHHVQFGAS